MGSRFPPNEKVFYERQSPTVQSKPLGRRNKHPPEFHRHILHSSLVRVAPILLTNTCPVSFLSFPKCQLYRASLAPRRRRRRRHDGTKLHPHPFPTPCPYPTLPADSNKSNGRCPMRHFGLRFESRPRDSGGRLLWPRKRTLNILGCDDACSYVRPTNKACTVANGTIFLCIEVRF